MVALVNLWIIFEQEFGKIIDRIIGLYFGAFDQALC
jgi:hypothetical protein